MANITAADVNKLRQQTGSGMMDCKKALVEADGDFEAAIDILRKKGQKVAANRGDRDANEGLVLAKTANNGKKAVLVVVNCETDFVAQNIDFNKFATTILDAAIEKNPASLDELKALKFGNDTLTIAEKIIEQTGVIGEKIEVSAYEVIEAETTIAYNHPGNKLASIVGFNKIGDKVNEVGKQIAMQVAAMGAESVEDLLQQDSIKDSDKTIELVIKSLSGKIGEKMTLSRFERYAIES